MKSLILRTTSSFLSALLAVFSIFGLVRGHHAPGGGFVGGLLLAGGLAVRSLSHGPRAARELLRVEPVTLVAVGLAVATAAAVAGPAAGGAFFAPLEGGYLPVVGKLGTVFLFDIGVYLAVAGTALRILLTLAEEEEEEEA